MKKLLAILTLLVFASPVFAEQDTGWQTKNDCLTLADPQASGTICLNTGTSGTLTRGHFYRYNSGTPSSSANWTDVTGNIGTAISSITGDITATGPGAVTGTLGAQYKVRPCELKWGSKVAGSTAIPTDDDVSQVCSNLTTATMTVVSVECTADNTITFDVTVGNGGSSILTGPVTCGTGGTFNSATLSGTPTIASGGTLDINVNTNAGSAKYAVLRIKRTL